MVKYSFISLVTDTKQYDEFKSSILTDYHTKTEIEFIAINNTGEKRYTAAEGLNKGAKEASGKYLFFAHQDILCNNNWLKNVQQKISAIESSDPFWGVLGFAGLTVRTTDEERVEFPGFVYLEKPVPHNPPYSVVMVLDELCLIVRRDSGLFFDEKTFSHFHFYGGDICLNAIKRGMQNYVLNVPTIHLSDGSANLRQHYEVFRKEAKAFYGKYHRDFPCIVTTTTLFLCGYIRYMIAERDKLEPRTEWLVEIRNKFDDVKKEFHRICWEHSIVMQTNILYWRMRAEKIAFKIERKVSIVIPVFNQLPYTKQCIDSIKAVTEKNLYKLIIVDNGSEQDTVNYLDSIKDENITVIRNRQNLGFAKACNQGAAAAKNRFLLFLNNDTIVRDGWLDPLLDEMVYNPDIGICGSKLLFPDNTIEHCGILISKEALPFQFYRGCPSNLPAANKKRAVSAITGACLLIERELFNKVGRFNETYFNGCEDLDLCCKVNEMGKRIVYVPESVITHFEGRSEERQQKMVGNREKFQKEWQWKATESAYDFFLRDGMKLIITPDNNFNYHDLSTGKTYGAPEDIMKRANEAALRGNFTEAYSIYKSILSTDKWNKDALLNIGKMALDKKIPEDPLPFFALLYNLNPLNETAKKAVDLLSAKTIN